MIKINPQSVRDLLLLHSSGIPVTLTSHPGNASLYKLVLWSLGMPEHLWDVTCVKADANNWPMHELVGGEARLLVSQAQYQRILKETSHDNRFVTAYQCTQEGIRLGRHHVRVMQKLFPNNISSCSRLLLSEEDKVLEVFDFLAHTRGDEVFARFITPEGVMQPICRSSIKKANMATSFVSLLHELDNLLFSDTSVEARGGACYDGVMIQLAVMLVQYWQTGRFDRYDISGPDMIHYATRPEYQAKLSDMLAHLHAWNPRLIPKDFLIHMFPGTALRVGYIQGHVSQEVMTRKLFMLEHAGTLTRNAKKQIVEEASQDEKKWPIQIRPHLDHYFSQHDLDLAGESLCTHEYWLDLPIWKVHETLSRANNFLRL